MQTHIIMCSQLYIMLESVFTRHVSKFEQQSCDEHFTSIFFIRGKCGNMRNDYDAGYYAKV